MAGFSIPASEHSTITSFGRENEVEAYRNMIHQYGGPGKIFACVSDSYDIYRAVGELWGGELKDEVVNMGGTLVIRPDSGDPTEVVLNILGILGIKFGFKVNSKGYKVLPDCVRVIQGDGVNPVSIEKILQKMEQESWSVDNITFGMGGAGLQIVNRDDNSFAQKCSSVIIDGKEVDVYKDPITSSGKRSKRGRLDLIKKDGELVTVRLFNGEISHIDSVMKIYFENGQLLVDEKFETIIDRCI
jgi:nicotinamide phosphoribosyltransferase